MNIVHKLFNTTMRSSGTAAVMVCDGGGGERRLSLPGPLRRVVPAGQPSGVAHQASCRHPPPTPATALPPYITLHDQCYIAYSEWFIKGF